MGRIHQKPAKDETGRRKPTSTPLPFIERYALRKDHSNVTSLIVSGTSPIVHGSPADGRLWAGQSRYSPNRTTADESRGRWTPGRRNDSRPSRKQQAAGRGAGRSDGLQKPGWSGWSGGGTSRPAPPVLPPDTRPREPPAAEQRYFSRPQIGTSSSKPRARHSRC